MHQVPRECAAHACISSTGNPTDNFQQSPGSPTAQFHPFVLRAKTASSQRNREAQKSINKYYDPMSQKHTTVSFTPTSVLNKGTEMEIITIQNPAGLLPGYRRCIHLTARALQARAGLQYKGHTDWENGCANRFFYHLLERNHRKPSLHQIPNQY